MQLTGRRSVKAPKKRHLFELIYLNEFIFNSTSPPACNAKKKKPMPLLISRTQLRCISPCLHACMHVCMHACMFACMHVITHTCMLLCMHACFTACMHACLHAYAFHSCLHACVSVCMHA